MHENGEIVKGKMKSIFLVCLSLFLSGCATGGVYKNPPVAEASATIKFQPMEGVGNFLSDSAVSPVMINGMNLSFWRTSDVFRLMPGMNTIRVEGLSSNKNTKAQCEFLLDAKAGETYFISREVEIESIKFIVKDSSGTVLFEKREQKKPVKDNGIYSPVYTPVR